MQTGVVVSASSALVRRERQQGQGKTLSLSMNLEDRRTRVIFVRILRLLGRIAWSCGIKSCGMKQLGIAFDAGTGGGQICGSNFCDEVGQLWELSGNPIYLDDFQIFVDGYCRCFRVGRQDQMKMQLVN